MKISFCTLVQPHYLQAKPDMIYLTQVSIEQNCVPTVLRSGKNLDDQDLVCVVKATQLGRKGPISSTYLVQSYKGLSPF
jgi:hypothetical protein